METSTRWLVLVSFTGVEWDWSAVQESEDAALVYCATQVRKNPKHIAVAVPIAALALDGAKTARLELVVGEHKYEVDPRGPERKETDG